VGKSLVEKRHEAIQDLSDIAIYLAEQSGRDSLAFRFIEAAESSFGDLAAMPEMGAAREFVDPGLAGVRMWRIAGFDNYRIFYRYSKNTVEIIRVLHAKREALR